MSNISKGLIWASVILAAAFFARWQGIDEDTSFALVTGLILAACTSMNTASKRCGGTKCLR